MKNYLPKVLIFAHDFPPCNSVGSQRPYSWYKYFKTFGLYPVIITKNWSSNIQSQVDYIKSSNKNQTIEIENEYGTIIKLNHKISFRDKLFIKYNYFPINYLRKILSFFIEILKYPFDYFDDNSIFYQEALNYSKQNKIDIIIATGEPFILFKYAHRLSKTLKIKWIADYRDGWTTDRTRNNAHFNKILKFYYSYFENKYLKRTLFCSFATNDLLLNHSKKYPFLRRFLVYNGFFSDNKIKYKELNAKNKFRIGYSGKILFFQPLELFLDGLNLFIEKHPNNTIEFNIYGGKFYEYVEKRIKKHCPNILSYINLTPRYSQEELYSYLKNDNVCLLLSSPIRPSIPVKLFDYLWLNKTIINVVSDNSELDQILQDFDSATICNTEQEICDFLSKEYNQFLNKKETSYNFTNKFIFDRKYQADLFVENIKKELYGC